MVQRELKVDSQIAADGYASGLYLERRRVCRPRGVAPSRCPTGNDVLAARVERHTVGEPFPATPAIHDRTKIYQTEGNDFLQLPSVTYPPIKRGRHSNKQNYVCRKYTYLCVFSIEYRP